MSELIGGSDVYSTWARVRTPVRQGVDGFEGFHSVEYPVNQAFWKTIQGNGLLRFDRAGFPFPTPPRFEFNAGQFIATGFLEPYDAKFVGETVTLTGPDTFNITAAAFIPPTYQTVSPPPTGSNPITAIGLLTPV